MSEGSPSQGKEYEIREMLSRIERVTIPQQVIDTSLVPEFDINASEKHKVIQITSGYSADSEKLPVRTDNVDICTVGLFRTPLPSGEFKVKIVHFFIGDESQNMKGHKREDIKVTLNSRTKGIFLITDNSPTNGIAIARQFAYIDVTTEKIINVKSGRSLVDVVYKLRENDIFARVHDDNKDEVQVFAGFD